MGEPMTVRTDGGNETNNHPAADLETIIVDPDDVIEMMRRNKRDEDEQHSHVLRVTPPLKGEQTASLYVVRDGNFYPDDVSPKPIHINAAFLFGGRVGARLDQRLQAPDFGVERGRFRDDYGLSADEELPDDEWDEWWDVAVEVWESEVRRAMRDPVEIQLGGYFAEEPQTTVEVRFEGGDD